MIDEARAPVLHELVVCSLEPWDERWRRNQFLTSELIERNLGLRVLFVEPAADPIHDVRSRRRPELPGIRRLEFSRGRAHAFQPLKILPRRAGSLVDRLLVQQVRAAARLLKLSSPVLWINDVTFAPLKSSTGWPAVYDITDDWLLAPFPERELARLSSLEKLALRDVEEVVVCSPALAKSRGDTRAVTVIPNAVDVDHFRRPRSRPADLPGSPVVVYVGTLHDARVDVELLLASAAFLPEVKFAMVGPDALQPGSHERLSALPNVVLLGARPYTDVPAYLQHADVVVVPHVVSPFTESLDPIKAYESLAVDTPTVATPVAGFRELAPEVVVAERGSFPGELARVLRSGQVRAENVRVPSWHDRGLAFEEVLVRAVASRPGSERPR
jgi:glycosyltransferase involved in cell wall biosynthesis